MAVSKIPKLVRYETYIEVKRAVAGAMPANGRGTFSASVIGIQPSEIGGFTLMGTLLETSKTGCVANYSENGVVNWQNITDTGQSDVEVIASHFYKRNV